MILSALLCFAGVGVLTLGAGLGFGSGERWCLLAALLYACTILVTDSLSHSGIDTLAAGVIQVGTIGALSLASSFLTEVPRLPAGTTEWFGILMLAVVCTGFGFTLQPVAQSGTSAERAGMFCALNPMVAAGLGVVFLQEPFTGKTLIGGILILLGILLAELPERQIERFLPLSRRKNRQAEHRLRKQAGSSVSVLMSLTKAPRQDILFASDHINNKTVLERTGEKC